MRPTKRQIQTLRRFPRSRAVWGQLGIHLSPSTRVLSDGTKIRVVRSAQTNGR